MFYLLEFDKIIFLSESLAGGLQEFHEKYEDLYTFGFFWILIKNYPIKIPKVCFLSNHSSVVGFLERIFDLRWKKATTIK